MKKVPPTIMPPHESPNLTLEQARQAWLKVFAEKEARRRRAARKGAPRPSSQPAA